MDYQNILVSLEGGITTVTVNRPEKMNALNAETIGELTHAFTNLPEGTGVVILTGAGPKAFVAGADIAELAEAMEAQAWRGVERAPADWNLGPDDDGED